MKKGWTLISMLLWLACVCRTGSAAERVSIRELHESIEQEPRWTASYEAYKREIEVDIPIDIPEVNAVPIVQVSGYYAVDQEGCLTRDGTKLNKIGNDGFDIYEEDGLMTYLSTTCANGEIKAAPFEQDKTVLFLAYYNSPSNLRTHKVKYDTEVYYPYEVDADKIYAEDNPQSATEAKAYLERVLGYFYPKSENSVALRHLEVRSRGHKVKGLDDYNLGDYAKDYPMGTYALSFCQTIQGIPVYHDVGWRLDTTGNAPHELIKDAWKKTEPIMGISDNRFEFMDDNSFEMLVRWVKEVGVIEEDVPLAPLSNIISSVEDEIQKGRIRKVYALRLGYGCYITEESPETYVLYPTWICECDYVADPKWEIDEWAYNLEKGFNKKYSFKTLVINAQTGEMDDPYLSKKGTDILSDDYHMGGCTMKKIFAALCTLMIVPTLALASGDMVSVSELRQQVERMGRWTASYEAYKREIEVDIPIDMPEVDAVPIVQVSGYYAVDQEGRLTRDGTKLNKIGYDGFDIYEEDGLMTYLSTTDVTGEINVSPFDKDKGVILLAYYNSPSNLRTHKVKYDSKVYYPYEVDADEIYAEDNPQSAAAAKAYLECVLGYFYPESDNSIALRYLEVRSRGHKVKGLDDYKLGDYVKNYPMGTYALNFCQTIQGIPVYHDVGERLDTTGYNNAPEGLIDDAWKKTEPIMGISDNRFEFMGDDSFEMLVRWVKEAGIIKEDVPLAPLSSIISSIEDEIQKGHIRNVYALRLGYGCYITNESPETYVLYPTWICDCDYIGDPKEKINVSAYNIEKDFNKRYTFKTLVINAQTGEMDDPYLSKKEQIFCPTIITWEDAQ